VDLAIHQCKDCGTEVRVNKYSTFFRCKECKEKHRQRTLIERSKNKCTNCGKEFEKDIHSREYHCPECKLKVEMLKTHTRCSRCCRILHRDNFPIGNTTVCFDCRNNREEEKEQLKNKIYLRSCYRCGANVQTTRFATIVICDNCEEQKQLQKFEKKKTVFIRKCLTCGCDVEVKSGHITFIHCDKCKSEQHEAKYKKRQFKENSFKCKYCGNRETVNDEDKKTYNYKTYVCTKCRVNITYKVRRVEKRCIVCDKLMIADKRRTTVVCNECKSKGLKPDLIKFGVKQHFGYYGTASDGHKWWSLNEQDVEEWLIHNNIRHICQARIGDTIKHADQYLPDYDLYIEIDGLSRKDDIDWNGKLSLYDKLSLKYKIVKPVEHHYYMNKDKCFEELDKEFEFLKPINTTNETSS